ncbi:MAG: NADP-dependent oxidoreductase, partial [Rhodobacteraceae bacterium]|nr:NADP-dependent oxidoreductase [Paracoccaceae bacterium]
MSAQENRRIVLASRPEGEPKPEHFRLETAAIPTPKDGEVLLRNLWMSLDPYMRGRMSAAKSYAKPVEVGEPMVAGTVSEVVKSNRPEYVPGDIVLSYTGWMDYAVSNGSDLRKLDPKQA